MSRLNTSGHPELGRLSIRIKGRTVTLGGKVRSYYLKQVAQTIVMSMDEVEAVCNDIGVVK